MEGAEQASVFKELQAVLDYWKGIDLNALRPAWDEQALAIKEFQDRSLSSRKKLAEQTRNFKKLSDEEKGRAVGPLLKMYQDEIDELTKRCKHSEAGFLGVFKTFFQAPDPVPAITATLAMQDSLGKQASVDQENAKLKEKVKEMESEFQVLKNQDTTIVRLEEELKGYRTQLDEAVRAAVEEREKTWALSHAKTVESASERETGLMSAIEQERKVSEGLRKMHEAAQEELFRLRSKDEETHVSHDTQHDMLTREVEMLSSRIASLESEKVALERLVSDGSAEYLREQTMEWEVERAQKDAQISQLAELVEHLQNECAQKTANSEREICEMQSELSSYSERVNQLEYELSTRPSTSEVAELKKRLEELSVFEQSTYGGGSGGSGAGSTDNGSESTADHVLGQRLRSLETETTKLKLALSEAQASLASSEQEREKQAEKMREQAALITQLEDDINRASFANGDTSSVMGGRSTTYAPSSAGPTISALSPPTNSVVSVLNPASAQTPTPPAPLGAGWTTSSVRSMSSYASGGQFDFKNVVSPGDEQRSEWSVPTGGSASGSDHMLRVVSGQRDRFKRRVQELEEENRTLSEQLSKLRSQHDALQTDNVKLYERIRFLQSYGGGGSSVSNPSAAAAQKRPGKGGDVESGESDYERKYKGLYEDSINPFSAFSKKEKDEKLKELSMPDRITLRTTRTLLSNKYTRMFTFFYALVLHLFILVMMYKMTSVTPRPCDP